MKTEKKRMFEEVRLYRKGDLHVSEINTGEVYIFREVEAGGWIKMTDRKPNEGDCVLLWDKRKLVAHSDGCYEDLRYHHLFSHWMPFTPPSSEDDCERAFEEEWEEYATQPIFEKNLTTTEKIESRTWFSKGYKAGKKERAG